MVSDTRNAFLQMKSVSRIALSANQQQKDMRHGLCVQSRRSDLPCRRRRRSGPSDAIHPSLPNARALHLGYRWQKASDDTLVMDRYFADTKAQACSLINKPEAQPPERERNDGRLYQRPPTTRMRFAVEWIGIAIILGGTGVLTLMSFLIEHNDLL